MTYCGPLFKALDKRLAEKMSIDEISKELCADVDDPRGKMIRLIKAHKGKEWLYENSDWLGYDIEHIRNPVGPRKMEIFAEEGLQHQLGQLAAILKDNRVSTNEQQGITIYGHLDEGMVKYICHIDPYKEEGFHFVTIQTFIDEESENGEDGSSVHMQISYIEVAYPDDIIDEVVDFCFYPTSYIKKLRKFIGGDLTEFPVPPKFKKSTHPDWEWIHHLSDRCDRNRWAP